MAIQIAIFANSMDKSYSIAEAKNRLPGLVHEAEQGRPVRLTRRGKPVAVLISEEQYRRLKAQKKPIDWGEPFIDTTTFRFDREEANAR